MSLLKALYFDSNNPPTTGVTPPAYNRMQLTPEQNDGGYVDDMENMEDMFSDAQKALNKKSREKHNKKYFQGPSSPQNVNTDTYGEAKKSMFIDYLRDNVEDVNEQRSLEILRNAYEEATGMPPMFNLGGNFYDNYDAFGTFGLNPIDPTISSWSNAYQQDRPGRGFLQDLLGFGTDFGKSMVMGKLQGPKTKVKQRQYYRSGEDDGLSGKQFDPKAYGIFGKARAKDETGDYLYGVGDIFNKERLASRKLAKEFQRGARQDVKADLAQARRDMSYSPWWNRSEENLQQRDLLREQKRDIKDNLVNWRRWEDVPEYGTVNQNSNIATEYNNQNTNTSDIGLGTGVSDLLTNPWAMKKDMYGRPVDANGNLLNPLRPYGQYGMSVRDQFGGMIDPRKWMYHNGGQSHNAFYGIGHIDHSGYVPTRRETVNPWDAQEEVNWDDPTGTNQWFYNSYRPKTAQDLFNTNFRVRQGWQEPYDPYYNPYRFGPNPNMQYDPNNVGGSDIVATKWNANREPIAWMNRKTGDITDAQGKVLKTVKQQLEEANFRTAPEVVDEATDPGKETGKGTGKGKGKGTDAGTGAGAGTGTGDNAADPMADYNTWLAQQAEKAGNTVAGGLGNVTDVVGGGAGFQFPGAGFPGYIEVAPGVRALSWGPNTNVETFSSDTKYGLFGGRPRRKNVYMTFGTGLPGSPNAPEAVAPPVLTPQELVEVMGAGPSPLMEATAPFMNQNVPVNPYTQPTQYMINENMGGPGTPLNMPTITMPPAPGVAPWAGEDEEMGRRRLFRGRRAEDMSQVPTRRGYIPTQKFGGMFNIGGEYGDPPVSPTVASTTNVVMPKIGPSSMGEAIAENQLYNQMLALQNDPTAVVGFANPNPGLAQDSIFYYPGQRTGNFTPYQIGRDRNYNVLYGVSDAPPSLRQMVQKGNITTGEAGVGLPGNRYIDIAGPDSETRYLPMYEYSGRPGVLYRKDSKGNWLINLSGDPAGDFIPIKDPEGKRKKVLDAQATRTYQYEQYGGRIYANGGPLQFSSMGKVIPMHGVNLDYPKQTLNNTTENQELKNKLYFPYGSDRPVYPVERPEREFSIKDNYRTYANGGMYPTQQPIMLSEQEIADILAAGGAIKYI